MWAFGRYCLGQSEDEFWDLTLAQFVALSQQYREEQKRLDQRNAVLCMIMANTHSRKRFGVDDFMPHPVQRGRKTPEQMLETVKQLHRRFTYGDRNKQVIRNNRRQNR
ncbi:MAG: hypothetical protein PHQ43_08750 [Dehalococcoidales bacterium]|nr:hypothetical protein [Dehalococcoidales bacterium]